MTVKIVSLPELLFGAMVKKEVMDLRAKISANDLTIKKKKKKVYFQV